MGGLRWSPRKEGQQPSRACQGWAAPVTAPRISAPCWRLRLALVALSSVSGTAVSPTHKQQLPVWLRLDDYRCQQTKEHKSRFIFISSSTVSWYFNALQVLIKDLSIRNLWEGLRTGSSETTQISQHFLQTTEGTFALPHLQNSELFTWQKNLSSWWRAPELLWQWSGTGCGALGCQGSTQRGLLQQREQGCLWMRDSAVLSSWSTKLILQLDSVPSLKHAGQKLAWTTENSSTCALFSFKTSGIPTTFPWTTLYVIQHLGSGLKSVLLCGLHYRNFTGLNWKTQFFQLCLVLHVLTSPVISLGEKFQPCRLASD